MKKVSTEPKSLSKPRTTGQSQTSSGNRWYIDGGEDDSDNLLNIGGRLHHAATAELLPVEAGQAATVHSGGSSASGGVINDSDDGNKRAPGTVVSSNARTKVARERIQSKMTRIMEMIVVEQAAKEENVNQYLRQSSGDMSTSSVERHQAQNVKAAFEKRNQKSTEKIIQLQRKLEVYSQRMRQLEKQGLIYADISVTSRSGHRQARAVFSHGFKSVTAMPKEFAHMIRSKFGSADNIKALADLSESIHLKPHSSDVRQRSGVLSSDLKYHSEENLVSLVCNEVSPPVSGSGEPTSSPQFRLIEHQTRVQLQHSWPDDKINIGLLVRELERNREMQIELQDCIADYQGHIEESQMMLRNLFEEQRLRSEHLEEQLNDMMELHQHEITDIKQELSSLEEKMEYQLEERTRDMQEVLESCQTKITKMELQQQQQQLISMEGFDGSGVRVLLSKLINVVLALLAVILVLLHTGINLVGPFLSTRVRCVITVLAAVCVAIFYHHRHSVFQFMMLSLESEDTAS